MAAIEDTNSISLTLPVCKIEDRTEASGIPEETEGEVTGKLQTISDSVRQLFAAFGEESPPVVTFASEYETVG